MPLPKIKILLLTLLTLLSFSLQADYYDSVINLTGDALFNGLRNLIDNNTNTSYDDSKDVLFQTLENVNGNVTCVYTGEVYYVGYNYNGSNNPNTEHTYAQSWFNGSDTSKKKSDLHHLFITNSVVNSSRGNYPFDMVHNHSTANVYYNDTPRQSYRGNNYTGRMVFEPADSFKGNIARAVLYFYTRYSGESLTQQSVNMLPTLLLWHVADPPDAAEVTRNNGVQAYQNNRNPYVDHPEFVARIWGGTDIADEVLPGLSELLLSSGYPNPFADQISIEISGKAPGNAKATIYNLKGQKVYQSTLSLPGDKYTYSWDGRDAGHQESPNGLYFLVVESGTQRAVTRFIKHR